MDSQNLKNYLADIIRFEVYVSQLEELVEKLESLKIKLDIRQVAEIVDIPAKTISTSYAAGIGAVAGIISIFPFTEQKAQAWAIGLAERFNRPVEHADWIEKLMMSITQIPKAALLGAGVGIIALIVISLMNGATKKRCIEQQNNRTARLQATYDAEFASRQPALKLCQKEIENNLALLHTTKENLTSLYNMGYLHPEFRNVVAAARIHDYFEMGTCATLDGPDGAYKTYLFESQFKEMNASLRHIKSSLIEIRDKLNMLYKEVVRANDELSEVIAILNAGINDEKDVLKALSNNIALNNVQQSIIAANTSLLAKIERNRYNSDAPAGQEIW